MVMAGLAPPAGTPEVLVIGGAVVATVAAVILAQSV